MCGDPTPNRDGEAPFYRKMIRFASVLGERKMRELGAAVLAQRNVSLNSECGTAERSETAEGRRGATRP